MPELFSDVVSDTWGNKKVRQMSGYGLTDL